MFTGIVETCGEVKSLGRGQGTKKLELHADDFFSAVNIGDSVAVDGVCLTATAVSKNLAKFDIMDETMSLSTLKGLKPRDKVNLERSLVVGSSVGGHFVYGHIDGTREIIGFSKTKDAALLDIALRNEDKIFVVEKGSIAIDGISLTVGKVMDDRIRLFLIPHTLNNTTLFSKKTHGLVNVEFDMMAKYVHKQSSKGQNISERFLKDKGFI